ncbi:MAG: TetR/AcrR family transcriptional regulator [Polyangiaceae bacterium]
MTRRSQAERSATTQAALLDATIECLVELGFEGTSTPEICRRAGVSRGAQLHHFPTKAELLVAAVEHLCERRHAEFRALVEARDSPSQRLDAAFDELWKLYSGPTLSAWIELTVAARTDPVLKQHMGGVSRRVEEEAEITLRKLFGIADDVPAKASVRMVLSLLDGLAFRRILQDDASARKSLDVFRTLVEPWLGHGK